MWVGSRSVSFCTALIGWGFSQLAGGYGQGHGAGVCGYRGDQGVDGRFSNHSREGRVSALFI